MMFLLKIKSINKETILKRLKQDRIWRSVLQGDLKTRVHLEVIICKTITLNKELEQAKTLI